MRLRRPAIVRQGQDTRSDADDVMAGIGHRTVLDRSDQVKVLRGYFVPAVGTLARGAVGRQNGVGHAHGSPIDKATAPPPVAGRARGVAGSSLPAQALRPIEHDGAIGGACLPARIIPDAACTAAIPSPAAGSITLRAQASVTTITAVAGSISANRGIYQGETGSLQPHATTVTTGKAATTASPITARSSLGRAGRASISAHTSGSRRVTAHRAGLNNATLGPGAPKEPTPETALPSPAAGPSISILARRVGWRAPITGLTRVASPATCAPRTTRACAIARNGAFAENADTIRRVWQGTDASSRAATFPVALPAPCAARTAGPRRTTRCGVATAPTAAARATGVAQPARAGLVLTDLALNDAKAGGGIYAASIPTVSTIARCASPFAAVSTPAAVTARARTVATSTADATRATGATLVGIPCPVQDDERVRHSEGLGAVYAATMTSSVAGTTLSSHSTNAARSSQCAVVPDASLSPSAPRSTGCTIATAVVADDTVRQHDRLLAPDSATRATSTTRSSVASLSSNTSGLGSQSAGPSGSTVAPRAALPAMPRFVPCQRAGV